MSQWRGTMAVRWEVVPLYIPTASNVKMFAIAALCMCFPSALFFFFSVPMGSVPAILELFISSPCHLSRPSAFHSIFFITWQVGKQCGQLSPENGIFITFWKKRQGGRGGFNGSSLVYGLMSSTRVPVLSIICTHCMHAFR